MKHETWYKYQTLDFSYSQRTTLICVRAVRARALSRSILQRVRFQEIPYIFSITGGKYVDIEILITRAKVRMPSGIQSDEQLSETAYLEDQNNETERDTDMRIYSENEAQQIGQW